MAQDTANKRTQLRNRCLREGKIVFGNGASILDCTIDNLSPTGAHLRVQGSATVPGEFLLVEPARSIVHKAQIVRRTSKGLGVRFTGVLEDRLACAAYLRNFKR